MQQLFIDFKKALDFRLSPWFEYCIFSSVHPAFEDGTDTGFRNVGQLQFDAGEIPRKKYTIFKKTYYSIRSKVLYNILIEFGIPVKMVRLIKMCMNETYSRIRVDRHLSDMLLMRNGLKEGDVLSPLLFNFPLDYTVKRVQVNKPWWL